MERPAVKTTEFWGAAVVAAVIALAPKLGIQVDDNTRALLLGLVTAIYTVSRSLAKSSDQVKTGAKTTEFWGTAVVGALVALAPQLGFQIDEQTQAAIIAGLTAVYGLCRGLLKWKNG